LTFINRLHAQLVQIKTAGPKFNGGGICYNVDFAFVRLELPALEVLREQAFAAWPKFSGDENYPIPGGEEAFDETHRENMWNPEHPYGALRLELLDFMIDYFSPENFKEKVSA